MTWRWRSDGPPGPRTIQPDSSEWLELPLDWDEPCEIHWSVPPTVGLELHEDPADPRRARIEVGPSLHGFHKVRWLVVGPPEASGAIRIRVPSAGSRLIRPSVVPNVEPVQGPPSTTPSSNPAPTPAPVAASSPVHSGTAPMSRTPGSARAAVAAPPPTTPLPRAAAGRAATPLPPGRYYLDVHRAGERIDHLRREVERTRTLVVGRFSGSRDGIPGLDLLGEFGPGEEASCSHRQAEVFWADGRILLVDRGRNRVLVAGSPGPAHEPLSLAPGDRVRLPGGVVLELVREAP